MQKMNATGLACQVLASAGIHMAYEYYHYSYSETWTLMMLVAYLFFEAFQEEEIGGKKRKPSVFFYYFILTSYNLHGILQDDKKMPLQSKDILFGNWKGFFQRMEVEGFHNSWNPYKDSVQHW